jgi:hypothetical protein
VVRVRLVHRWVRDDEGDRGWSLWAICEKKAQYLYRKVFKADVYAFLACVYEIQTNVRPEKYVSICSDCQAALKALQAAKTTSPLVRQCLNALYDISTRHSVGLYCVSGHAGVRGNEIADKLARGGSVQKFVGPEPYIP